MKTFRLTYTKTITTVVEMEAGSPLAAWKKIMAGELVTEGADQNVIWMHEGDLKYEVETTEEIVKQIASNPS